MCMTCFDECFFYSMLGRNYFLFNLLVTKRFGAKAIAALLERSPHFMSVDLQ